LYLKEYFLGNLNIFAWFIGGSTYLALRSPAVMSLMSRGGLISIFATIACMIGLQIGVRSAPYQAGEFNGVKKAFWAAHAAFLGALIAPLVAMYGDVVAQVRVKISS